MLLLLRKAIFYLLLLAYLVITPYLIFYGLGYGVDPAEREIYKTGLVSIVTEPKGAAVFLEDKKYSGKTPAAISGLLPGQYHVRLALKGYEPWQKTVEIVAEKATRLEPVVLLPKRAKEEQLVEGVFEDLLPKGSDFKIFVREGETLQDFAKIDLFFRKKTPLVREKKNREPVRILEDKMLAESSVVLFGIEKQGRSGWLLFDLEREKIVADLTPQIPEKADLVDWDPRSPDFVCFLNDNQLTLVDLEEAKTHSVGNHDILGIGARQRRLYILKKDLTLWQANARGENAVRLTEKDGVEGKVFLNGAAPYYQIELLKRLLFQRELFLFLSGHGALSSNWPPYRLVEKNVRGFLHGLGGDSEKILFWTGEEIGVFDFALKPEEEETLPPRTLLYRSGKNIRQVFWAFDQTHVIFLNEDEIFFLEAGGSAPYLIQGLGPVAPGSRIFYHDRQRTLYYLNPDGRKLMRRKISE